MKKSWLYIFSIACIAAVAFISGLEKAQVVSISLFLALILGTLFFWRFRLAFAFIAMALLLGFGVLDIYHLIEFAGLDIVLFLVGMMVVIGFLEEYRFFEILTNKIINIVGNNINKLIIVIMILSALFAALVDEVTSILFMTSTVLHLTGKYRVNPTPYIIMTVFATNIGSSATVVGNPVGVMIALRAGLTFADFLRWASPISILSLIVIIPLTMKYFNKEIKEFENRLTNSLNVKNNFEEIIPRNKFILSLIIFSSTITLLILHNQVEKLLHLEKNTMLLGTALGMAGIVLIIERNKARELLEKRVDWWTLSFFIILFASVGTLKMTGITSIFAKGFLSLAKGNEIFFFVSFTFIIGVLSAFMDNVLAIATIIPIIQDLQTMGIYVFPLWWCSLFAATHFGNLTMIGSTANIVAIGVLERRKLGHITFLQWIKPGLIVSLTTITVALLLVLAQIPLMSR